MKTWYDVHTKDEWEGAPQAFQENWFKMVPGWWNWRWLSTLLHIPVGSQLSTSERCVNVWGFVLLGCWVSCFFKVAMFGKRMDHDTKYWNILDRLWIWILVRCQHFDSPVKGALHGAGQWNSSLGPLGLKADVTFSKCSTCWCINQLWHKLGLPSRELTYPPKMAFWRWFSLSPGGICQFPGGYWFCAPETSFKVHHHVTYWIIQDAGRFWAPCTQWCGKVQVQLWNKDEFGFSISVGAADSWLSTDNVRCWFQTFMFWIFLKLMSCSVHLDTLVLIKWPSNFNFEAK